MQMCVSGEAVFVANCAVSAVNYSLTFGHAVCIPDIATNILQFRIMKFVAAKYRLSKQRRLAVGLSIVQSEPARHYGFCIYQAQHPMFSFGPFVPADRSRHIHEPATLTIYGRSPTNASAQ